MSLPIYMKPHEKEIIEELKLHGYNKVAIESLIYDFRGKKREEEFLKFIRDNKNISFEKLMEKKIELKEKYEEFWGYIIDEDGFEYYNPEKFIKEL